MAEENHTIVNAGAYAGRAQLMAGLPHGGVGVEVGVLEGEFALQIFQCNEPAHLFLVDCWRVQPQDVYDTADSSSWLTQAEYDAAYAKCRTRLRDAGVEHRATLIRNFSVAAANMFHDGVLDWAWIDANHLRCYEDMCAWWPKVKPGGYLGGHDYDDYSTCMTVKQDADRFAAERGLRLTVTTDRDPCWLIYKAPAEDV
jgi:hypothetical protein